MINTQKTFTIKIILLQKVLFLRKGSIVYFLDVSALLLQSARWAQSLETLDLYETLVFYFNKKSLYNAGK